MKQLSTYLDEPIYRELCSIRYDLIISGELDITNSIVVNRLIHEYFIKNNIGNIPDTVYKNYLAKSEKRSINIRNTKQKRGVKSKTKE